ncbi:zinc-binding dehydrogenase [Streptomyces sp. M19]
MAFDYDGAWAQYVAVPAAALVRVPESIPLEQAAVLADAVSTPYGAVVATGNVRPAEAVGIWGLGGLGTHAVQIARLCGASPIIALDPLPGARERALKLGADAALDPADEGPAAYQGADRGRGLRAAFDCVGKAASFRQAEAALGHRGRLVLVGLSPDSLDFGSELAFTVKRHSVIGHLGYRKEHMEELVELVARGRLDISGSVSEILPLEEIQEGVRKLHEYEGNPIRIIVRP